MIGVMSENMFQQCLDAGLVEVLNHNGERYTLEAKYEPKETRYYISYVGKSKTTSVSSIDLGSAIQGIKDRLICWH